MEEKDNACNMLAVKYLGRALIVFIVGFFMFLSAMYGYNTYISVTHEKIEVQAENSNLTK